MRVYASAEMTLTDTNDGVSVTGIDRYYMASSSSSGITVGSQGWKPDPQETNPISRYHWSYEVVNYSDGAKIPSKPAVIGVYGKDGKEGIDAVTVSLSSEAHTFAGTESKAVASSITIDIYAFKGSQRIPTSIGTITGGISGQLTHSELGRGTTSNRLVINATSSLAKANGTLSIPIVADGRTFNKVFSWSVAFKGIPGNNGTDGTTTYTWIRYADTPTSGMSNSALDKKYIGLAFNQTTQTESSDYGDYQWSLMPQNIEVGGRNLIKRSDFGKIVLSGASGVAVLDEDYQNGLKATGGNNQRNNYIEFPNVLSGNGWYTVSFLARGTQNGARGLSVIIGDSPALTDGRISNSSNEYTYHTYSYKVESYNSETNNSIKIAELDFAYYRFDNIKLEKGNTATDWSPAPEDVQSQIDKSVKSTDVEYYLSTSSTGLAGGKWQTTAPPWDDGKYMWSRTKVVLNDGTPIYNPSTTGTNITGASGATGSPGATGRGVSSIVEQFYLSDSKTTRTGGSWSTKMPTWSVGKYVWTRSLITYTTGTPATSTTEPLVSSEWEAVNDLQIGVRNLLRNSNFTDGFAYWTGTGTRELISDAVFGSVAKITTTSNTGLVQNPTKELIVGKEYTLSTYVKAENTSQTVYIAIDGMGTGAAKAHIVSNEWTKISSVFTFSGVNLNARIYSLGVLYVANVKLEEGNKATDWTESPEDVYKNSEDVAQAKAEAERIKAEAYADGKVTAEEKERIAQAEQVLKDAKAHALQSVQNIEIGGRNLLRNSGEEVSNELYNIARYDLTDEIKEGEEVTLTIWGSLATTKRNFSAYNSGGSVSVAALTDNGDGTYSSTFRWKIGSSTNTYLNVYAFTNAQTGASTINKIKLEKGNKATDWTPAPEDTQAEIDNTKEQVKKTVKTITEEYYQSTKSDVLVGGRWTETAPTWDANKFMFVRSKITYVDGTTDYTPEINLSGAKGDKGDDGKSQWVHIRYSPNPTGSGMTTNPSSTTKYIGIAVTNSATAPAFPEFNWSKYVGEKGDPGQPGQPGGKGDDGKTTYTWVKYADTPTSGMNDFPAGKKYIGLAFNKTTQTESTSYSDYQWSLMPQNIEIGGRNLIIRNTETPNTWVNGAGDIVSSDNHDTSDYIKVEPSTDYMLTKNESELATDAGFFRWGWYDVDMAYISRRADSNNEILWKTPDNVHYVRVSYPTDSFPKLEKGNTATDWTEAPEDTQAKINDKASAEDLINAENGLSTSIGDLSNIVDGKVDKSLYEEFLEHNANIQEQLSTSTANAQEDISKALARTATVEQKLGEGAADWIFTHTQIRMSDEGITLGEEGSGSYLQITNDQISFYNGSAEPVAFINGGMLNINHAIFVESIQISEFMFSSEAPGHLTLRYVGN